MNALSLSTKRRLLNNVQSWISHVSIRKNHARTYLENWAGTTIKTRPSTSHVAPSDDHSSTAEGSSSRNKRNTGGPVPFLSPNHGNPPQTALQITGSSYLLPTLRLPRNTTGSSLSSHLASFLGSNGHSSGNAQNHAMKSMLRPKLLPGTQTSTRVPIILDLSAFQHDGSPHYKPPENGFLPCVVQALDEWGIAVMGLTNVPTDGNIGHDIHSLGLTVLGRIGSGRILGKKKGGDKIGGDAIGIDELVQMLLLNQQPDEESTLAAENPEEKLCLNSVKNESCTSSDTSSDEMTQLLVDKSNKGMAVNDADITRDKILSMSFDDLQKTCHSLSLDTTGPVAVLYDRLLQHYKLEPAFIPSSYSLEHVAETKLVEQILKNRTDAISVIPPKLYHGSVRSGQQVSTDIPHQSLVILGNVNSGGEVMADGDIYIFGSLRGRALAGLSDMQKMEDSHHEGYDISGGCGGGGARSSRSNHGSMIVCTHFDAELICIGEVFTTMDGAMEEFGLVQSGESVMIRTDENGSLKFIRFG